MSLHKITKDAMFSIDEHYKNKYKLKKILLFLTVISLCISILFVNIEAIYTYFTKPGTLEMLIVDLIIIAISLTIPYTYMLIFIINVLKKFKYFNTSFKYKQGKYDQLLQSSKIFKYMHRAICVITIFMLFTYTIYYSGDIYRSDLEFAFVPILSLICLVIIEILNIISLFVVAFSSKINKDLIFDLNVYADEVRRARRADSQYNRKKEKTNVDKNAKTALRKGKSPSKVSDETKPVRKVDVKDIY